MTISTRQRVLVGGLHARVIRPLLFLPRGLGTPPPGRAGRVTGLPQAGRFPGWPVPEAPDRTAIGVANGIRALESWLVTPRLATTARTLLAVESARRRVKPLCQRGEWIRGRRSWSTGGPAGRDSVARWSSIEDGRLVRRRLESEARSPRRSGDDSLGRARGRGVQCRRPGRIGLLPSWPMAETME